MNDLFEGVTSWIAETYDGLCSEIGAGIQEKDASRVMVNALLVVGFTGGMSAVVVGVCALAAYFWEWLICIVGSFDYSYSAISLAGCP